MQKKKKSKFSRVFKNTKHKDDASKLAQVAEKILWISRVKQPFTTVESTDKMIKARLEKNRLKRHLPRLKTTYVVDEKYKKEVYRFGEQNCNRVILYLHGGAFINQPLRQHWKFVDNLYQETKIPIVFPLYPKAPEYNYKDTIKYLDKIYSDLLKKDYEEIIFMGDSAGGGLVLSLVQYFEEKNVKVPNKLILLSPWVDLTMENEKIDKYEKVDPMLAKVGLREIGRVWANDSDLTNYLLSPINGKLDLSYEVTLIVGTHEIFLPDVRKLKKILVENNHKVHYYEYKNMNHVFPLYPIPEADKAFKQILKSINV